MSKSVTSILLAIFMTVVVVSPMLVAMVDNTVEVGLFESSEEEKDTRGESNLEIEKLLSNHVLGDFSSEEVSSNTYLGYFFKSYPVPHLNLVSPPPELV